jgi:RimJ/RimL family protein N-acetyltransferase
VSVRLIDLTLPILEPLAAGDATAAREAIGLEIPPDFTAREGFWEAFATKLRDAPDSAGWHVYAVVADDVIVGDAGFKGAPDSDGAVEIGYATLPDHRRNGHAVAAVRLLLERAAADPAVHLVRAEVEHGNDASVAVLVSAGFVPAGERIDPEDGRLLLFSHATGSAP